MQNLATCLLALERGGRGVLLMTFHLMVEFVSARNYHEIDSFNITMLLCEMLTLAWKILIWTHPQNSFQNNGQVISF